MLSVSEACHIHENHLVNLKSHEKAAFAIKMVAVASSGTFVIADYTASRHTVCLITDQLNTLSLKNKL